MVTLSNSLGTGTNWFQLIFESYWRKFLMKKLRHLELKYWKAMWKFEMN